MVHSHPMVLLVIVSEYMDILLHVQEFITTVDLHTKVHYSFTTSIHYQRGGYIIFV